MAVDYTVLETVQTAGLGDDMYYRRADGSVTCGPAGKSNNEMHQFMAEGWTPLREYGRFKLSEWTCSHPFETLIQRGGAHEIGVKQLLEMGYHHSPPLIPSCGKAPLDQGHIEHRAACWRGARAAVFPQLDGMDLPPAALCSFCDDDLKYPTAKARDQHIRVMHQEELNAVRSGEATAQALAKALGEMGVQRQPYACGECKDSFADVEALAAHVALHEAAVPPKGKARP